VVLNFLPSFTSVQISVISRSGFPSGDTHLQIALHFLLALQPSPGFLPSHAASASQ